jgi:uncharacterized repeat protein (TIGR03803 family)
MNKGIRMGLASGKTCRVVTFILFVLVGKPDNASAQTLTVLYSFVGSASDGATPLAALVQGTDGNFYGTTAEGGTKGYGTVFRVSPSGNHSNLYSFGSSPNDGIEPYARLVQGSDGNFYGTTTHGGTNYAGIVFRISPSGSYTNLYSFGGFPNDGRYPAAGLMQGSDGNFYGKTEQGGTSGNGTVFRISAGGSYSNLYSFAGAPDYVMVPAAGLVQGIDGNFYGTTQNGGTSNRGTVFRISPSGDYTNLYSFGGSLDDGANPHAGLVLGSDGNFYGTTIYGGTNFFQSGTVFQIGPSGNYTNLCSFGETPSDGANPQAALVQGSDGNFYGTTMYGGMNYAGTVFKLTFPLNPPANQISAIRIVGNDVAISVPSVAYETYQLQFSSSMTRTNWINVPSASVTNSVGALLTVTNFGGAAGPQGFYRFAITP